MKKFLSVFTVLLYTGFSAIAQDTLPQFTLKNIGDRHILISWKNNYELVKQISIQRSSDSLKNFKTIMSVADPTSKENGFADTKAPGDNLYYRLFIVMDNGGFVFTTAKKPVLDSSIAKRPPPVPETKIEPAIATPALKQDKSKTEKLDFPEKSNNTTSSREINNSKPNLNVFVPSLHVYTYKDGNVRITLPENEDRKYSIKFFEEDNSFVFEIKEIKQTPVLLDKANFYHAGWFKFELYEDGKLIEKNKFKINSEF